MEAELLARIAAAMPSAPAEGRVLLAFSGGADSVCLAEALRRLGYSLALAHVNYGLRGEESEGDEAFARSYARERGWPFECLRVEAGEWKPGLSRQAQARNLRYAFFERLLAEGAYACCATAHHADDEAETLLLTLLRGHGTALMRGIPPRRGPYVRPLLGLSRAELRHLLDHWGQAWREDSSNQGQAYLRNRIRHRLIPLLEELQPGTSARLRTRGAWHAMQNRVLRQLLGEAGKGGASEAGAAWSLDWRALEARLGQETARLWLAYELEARGLRGYPLWEALDLMDAAPGRKAQAPGGWLLRTREGLAFLPDETPAVLHIEGPEQLPARLGLPGAHLDLEWEEGRPRFGDPNLLYLDAEALRWPLSVRPWRAGDRMIPFGMHQSRKLSDIFTDLKFSPLARSQARVLEDTEGIVALSPFRIAERAKLGPGTRSVLRIRFSLSPESPA
jgi:tRNA(Ile)-lysidine synthase